jgi:hypothetical protein
LRLLIFELIAAGAQIYDCDADDRGFDWAQGTPGGSVSSVKGFNDSPGGFGV